MPMHAPDAPPSTSPNAPVRPAERYDQRITSLTISNLRVWQIGDVITLLQDAGYSVEINIDREP